MRLTRPSVFADCPSISFQRLYSSSRIIRQNDVLFLRQKGTKGPKWHLTSPLRPDARIRLGYGASVSASDLIGRRILDSIVDSSNRKVDILEPTLGSYILNSERMATPIYPHHANFIVSLLDLNLSQPNEEDYDPETNEPLPPMEIFEAGTGMGSLTLHLARALTAANPAIPSTLRDDLCSARYKPEGRGLDLSGEVQAAYDSYRSSRRAVLHTLDQNTRHSRAANQLVRRYRRSIYYPTVDFHTGSISDYISPRLAETDGQPIFSHAILDLPSVEDYASPVIQALHPNGLLVVFAPSISQIARFQAWAAETKQPVRQERVIELDVSTTADGVLDTGGGREWDVKQVTPKNDPTGVPVQVMRPKVGDRISGGGFVGVYRRWPIKQTGPQVESVGEGVSNAEVASESAQEESVQEESVQEESLSDAEASSEPNHEESSSDTQETTEAGEQVEIKPSKSVYVNNT
ncbi:S-adenosyl-L-methionine-dependent methyltransferase [Fusarium flagelliforme]|uniref:tRNA (adenine(58)-N(1))-methyltransferase catalytic subunit TRM61 n=1 Tax=Fusarium flagelliforme TaxID=2675880 RepID=A0A395MCL5_9HYPO|nr:S-adenosyl-L-methionine-dependent methyltransferase [Fusarium flagelliforme]KAH7198726.1 S-adenosyl-L-methionine-dependent methyltransferase [Fusarium flagelliforme]RFN45657.1 trna (adenine-n(1)-)-methyltransferase trmi [Fusarium flagelliforme]